MKILKFSLICIFLNSLVSPTKAEIVALQDFDGGDLNLLSSNVPSIDGGGGDTFAVGATQAWPTTGGTPFSLADNSVGDVGDTTAFPGDTEGVFGINSNPSNNFLGISDTRSDGADFTGNPVTATWTFDISGFSNLTLSIGMGSMEGGATFNYAADTLFTFDYVIDGGAATNAFTVAPGGAFTYRALDDGTIVSEETALFAVGANAVTKFSAETGLAALDTFLDKSLASNGSLDNFTTAINGSGIQLTLTLNAYIPFEGAAFDNIRIDGVTAIPEPASMSLLGLALVGTGLYQKRKRRKSDGLN